MTAANRGSISRPKIGQNNWTPQDWIGKTLTGDVPCLIWAAKPPVSDATRDWFCVCDDDFGYWEFKDRFLEGVGAGYTQHYLE